MALLGKGGLLEDTKRALWISDWCGGLPFKWNDQLNQLKLKSGKERFYFKLRLGAGVLYCILALIQVCFVIRNSSLVVITHTMLTLTCGILVISSQIANFSHVSGVVNLFNNFIQLERNFLNSNAERKSKSKSKKISLQCIIYVLVFTGINVPLTYHLDGLRNPCFPMYVGYWMSSQCVADNSGYYLEPTWSPAEIMTKLGISLASFLNFSFLISGFVFQAAMEYVIEGNCFRVYLSEFGRNLSRFSKYDTRCLHKSTLLYRQLQIMSIHYRLYFSKYQIGCGVLACISMQTACLFNTISWLSGKGTGGPIWYSLMYTWTELFLIAMVIFVFGILSDVYQVSKKVKVKINGNPELKRNKWFRRWMKTYSVLKIYFGGSNFFDRLTPLIFQNFAIDQTVSLLLLQTR